MALSFRSGAPSGPASAASWVAWERTSSSTRSSSASAVENPQRETFKAANPTAMRTNLTVGDLGSFLEEALVAVLATLRADGSVLLSPVYHEWHEGGFNVVVDAENVKTRHLRRDPRATIVVAESDAPLRGVEVRGSARFIEEDVTEIARRITARYAGEEDAAADAETL